MGQGLNWDLAYGVMQGGGQEEWRFQEDDGDERVHFIGGFG
jgi:hypothetical protein